MAYKKIVISGEPIRKEGIAAGTITPGDLIERTTTSRNVRRHSTNHGMVCPKMFAVEDSLQGNDIDDNYTTSSDRVQFCIPRAGDEIYARYNTGTGYTPAINDLMASNGDGTLRLYQTMEDSSGLGETNPSEVAVGRCLEAGSGGRVRIEII